MEPLGTEWPKTLKSPTALQSTAESSMVAHSWKHSQMSLESLHRRGWRLMLMVSAGYKERDCQTVGVQGQRPMSNCEDGCSPGGVRFEARSRSGETSPWSTK